MNEEQKRQYQIVINTIKRNQIELRQDNDYLEYLKSRLVKEENYEFIKSCDDCIKINKELYDIAGMFLHIPPPDEIQFMAKLYLSFLDEYEVKKDKILDAFYKQKDKNLHT